MIYVLYVFSTPTSAYADALTERFDNPSVVSDGSSLADRVIEAVKKLIEFNRRRSQPSTTSPRPTVSSSIEPQKRRREYALKAASFSAAGYPSSAAYLSYFTKMATSKVFIRDLTRELFYLIVRASGSTSTVPVTELANFLSGNEICATCGWNGYPSSAAYLSYFTKMATSKVFIRDLTRELFLFYLSGSTSTVPVTELANFLSGNEICATCGWKAPAIRAVMVRRQLPLPPNTARYLLQPRAVHHLPQRRRHPAPDMLRGR
jgi:hypothetical protein